MAKVIDRVLEQRSRARREQRLFEIYNTKFLKIVTRSPLRQSKYHLNLSMMAPLPIRRRKIAWRWLAAALGSAGVGLAGLSYADQVPPAIAAPVPWVSAALLLLGLASAFLFVLHSSSSTVFRSRYGRAALIELLHNKPDKASFVNFVAELRARTQTANENLQFEKRHMLAIELEELRRLVAEGAIPPKVYEKAKTRIMGMHQD